jgi:DHA2 family lincomycin resistance protein-like MFS transporter
MSEPTSRLDTAASPHDSDRSGALASRDRLVITLLLISSFVVILNETIMSVALPRLMDDLSIEASTAQWLTTAFMLTMAVVIPVTGWLLQRISTRTIFILAMSLFSLGTVLAAVSPGIEMLIAARVVQASGTAIMIPLLFTTVLTLVPEQSRGRVMGNISIVISVAPAVGPTISGVILHLLDWRWMFVIVAPIAIVALVVGARLIPNITEPRKTPLDAVSVVLSAFGFGGLVYGLSSVTTAGGTSTIISLIVGVVALVVFVLRQLRLQKRDEALLDMRVFLNPGFTFAIIMFVVSMMALFGTLTLVPIYTVKVLGLDELETGLLLLPGGLVMGLLAPFVGRLYDRIGPRPLVVPGAVIVSVVLWGLTTLDAQTPFWWLLIAHVTLSVGLALLFTPLFTAGLGAIPPNLYSHGSAVLSTIQQLAGAAGITLFITVMSLGVIGAGGTGTDDPIATAAGVHSAFIVGAIISVIAIPIAFLIRRPAASADAPVGH